MCLFFQAEDGIRGADEGLEFRRVLFRSGHGYATEAAAPSLAQGFAKEAMREAVADIHPDNVASQRVAEKIGLRFTGMVDYHGSPARRYSITREAFEQRPGC